MNVCTTGFITASNGMLWTRSWRKIYLAKLVNHFRNSKTPLAKFQNHFDMQNRFGNIGARKYREKIQTNKTTTTTD